MAHATFYSISGIQVRAKVISKLSLFLFTPQNLIFRAFSALLALHSTMHCQKYAMWLPLLPPIFVTIVHCACTIYFYSDPRLIFTVSLVSDLVMYANALYGLSWNRFMISSRLLV